MEEIRCRGRWREELETVSPEGKLIFELVLHVYFPDQKRWLECSPAWARDKWNLYRETCQAWSKQNSVPFSIVSDANFYEEK